MAINLPYSAALPALVKNLVLFHGPKEKRKDAVVVRAPVDEATLVLAQCDVRMPTLVAGAAGLRPTAPHPAGGGLYLPLYFCGQLQAPASRCELRLPCRDIKFWL